MQKIEIDLKHITLHYITLHYIRVQSLLVSGPTIISIAIQSFTPINMSSQGHNVMSWTDIIQDISRIWKDFCFFRM